MLTRLFNNLSFQALIFALLVSYFLTGTVVILYNSDNYQWEGFLFNVQLNEIWLKTIYIFIIPLLSWWFSSLLHKYNLLKSHYYFIPLFSLQLCMLGLGGLREDILLSLPLLIWLMVKITMILRTSSPYENCFDIGIGIGMLSLIVPEFIFLHLPLILALIIFGTFNIRTLLIPTLGTFALYFVLFFIFYFSSDFNFWNKLGKYFSQIGYSLDSHWDHLWGYLPVAILFAYACMEYVGAAGHAKIMKRQFLNFNILMFILVLLLGSFLKDRQVLYLILAFPLSLLQANLLQYLKKWWIKDLAFLLVICSLFLVAFRN